jgi:predicted HNH restriction endonuclease
LVLNAHHIKAWNKYPKLRLTLSNLLTVCRECHLVIHFGLKRGLPSG